MEIMGRGLSQIIQETPQYFHLLSKYAGWKLFKRRSPIFGGTFHRTNGGFCSLVWSKRIFMELRAVKF